MCVCVIRVLTAGCVGVWVGTLWDKYTGVCSTFCAVQASWCVQDCMYGVRLYVVCIRVLMSVCVCAHKDT